jgi:HD superfamily phosphodiesterase
MNISKVQDYINAIFDQSPDALERHNAYTHTYGVAQLCALLAVKRGLDPVLASIIGLLHDVNIYKTGVRSLHSHNGAEMVRVAFKHELSGLFTDEEHPLTTAPVVGASWSRDENNNILHYNLTDYGINGKRSTTWIVDGVIKYHRTFSDIVNA